MPRYMFTLHPQIERDSFFLTDLRLSRVLLMNNALFPWLILVPQVASAREIIDLDTKQRHRLMDEIAFASDIMKQLFIPDKLNVAALGNQVPQLHVHVIARFTKDSAWPNPVWGTGSEPYVEPEPLKQRLAQALSAARAS